MTRGEFAKYLNITSGTTTTVKSGPGVLVSIIVNKAVASDTITIYDNTAGSGTKIGTITHPATLTSNQYTLPYLVQFSTGLTIVTSGADDLTVIYE
jgi:hypothetical protein